MTGIELITYILIICCYLAPVALVLNSKTTRGQEKNAWLLAVLLLSWFAWLIYISTAKAHPPKAKQSKPTK